jgi:hypothetical protein
VAADRAVLADGGDHPVGTAEAKPQNSSGEQPDETEADNEDCEDCLDDFPCWDCVRTGKCSLPTE